MVKKLIAYVESGKQPQEGQKHRSSSNFHLVQRSNSVTPPIRYIWEIEGEEGEEKVNFKVKEDKWGTDPIRLEKVYNGYQSDVISNIDKLYIADPDNAAEKFFVIVYAVYNEYTEHYFPME